MKKFPTPKEIRRNLKACLKAWSSILPPERAAQPPYEIWKKHAEKGEDLPSAPPMLRPWRARRAKNDHRPLAHDFGPRKALKPIRKGDLLFTDLRISPIEEQALQRALDRNPGRNGDPRIFRPDPLLEGYSWYDAIPRVLGVEAVVAPGAKPRASDGTPYGPLPQRVHNIVIECIAAGPGEENLLTVRFPTDLAFAQPTRWVGNVSPIVTRDSDLTVKQLVRILRKGLFQAHTLEHEEELDGDSIRTQRTYFDDIALHVALRVLKGDRRAFERTAVRIVRREARWTIPEGSSIRIGGTEILPEEAGGS